ncbi:MAG: hypothetical protein Q9176_004885 [Flavoplaca citrina]
MSTNPHSSAQRPRRSRRIHDRQTAIPSAAENELTDVDENILELADGDTTEEEDESDIIHAGPNLRVRQSATNNCLENRPYLDPFREARARQRNQRSGVTMGNLEPENDVPSASSGPSTYTPAPLPETSQDAKSLAMFLDAAKLLEQNQIPCTSPDCPAPHPHMEGPYLFEGKVPNSELADVYFAPSIPPPAVVEAYNNIEKMPSLADLEIHDRFFAYHTVPCRPSRYLNKVGKSQCKSKNCGVDLQPHKTGAYLHDGYDASLHLSRRTCHVFGVSNPPPDIWDAAIRIQDGSATDRDLERVDDFSIHHSHFDVDDARRTELQSWQKERRSVRP